MKDLLNDALDRLESQYEQDAPISGLSTGYAGLDQLTSGLQPSTLVAIAGRPASGKTALALGAASHAAITESRPVLYFSLQVTASALTDRLLSADAHVDLVALRAGRLREAQWERLSHSIGRLADAPLYVDDAADISLEEIESIATRVVERVGSLSLIVIDNIHLLADIDGDPNEGDRIARQLKHLARRVGTVVVVTAGVSDEVERRADHRPMLRDVLLPGLSDHADVVVLMYQSDMYYPESADAGTAELIVAKHRNGPTGIDRLAVLRRYGKLMNIARDADTSTTPPLPSVRSRQLTERQLAVMREVADGSSNQEAAAKLGISVSTVKRELATISESLALKTRYDIGMYWRQMGFEPPDGLNRSA